MSGEGTPTLRASGIRIDLRGGTPVIDGVDLEIAPGEIFGIVGESGSGKTTTALSLFGQQDRALVMSSGEISASRRKPQRPLEVRGGAWSPDLLHAAEPGNSSESVATSRQDRPRHDRKPPRLGGRRGAAIRAL